MNYVQQKKKICWKMIITMAIVIAVGGCATVNDDNNVYIIHNAHNQLVEVHPTTVCPNVQYVGCIRYNQQFNSWTLYDPEYNQSILNHEIAHSNDMEHTDWTQVGNKWCVTITHEDILHEFHLGQVLCVVRDPKEERHRLSSSIE